MRKPQVDDLCTVLYEGREVQAKVTTILDNSFNVRMSFGEYMFDIPNEKFTYMPSIGNQIVNFIEETYGLGLYTVDAMSITEDIDALIQKNRWALK